MNPNRYIVRLVRALVVIFFASKKVFINISAHIVSHLCVDGQTSQVKTFLLNFFYELYVKLTVGKYFRDNFAHHFNVTHFFV